MDAEIYEVYSVSEKYSLLEREKEKYLIYNDDNDLKEGYMIVLSGKAIYLKEQNNDFYTYLNKQGINYMIKYDNLEIISDNERLNNELVDRLLKNKSDTHRSYLKLILFNDKDSLNRSLYEQFSLYSLTYLVAVSGFHINILLSFLKKLFRNKGIAFLIVGFYIYLLNFTVSSYRAFLYYIFKKINKRMNFNLTKVDVLSLIGIVFIVLEPCIIFSYSFIFSFLSSFVLELILSFKRNDKLLFFYIYLVNIPLILLNNYMLNTNTLLMAILIKIPISFLYIFSFIYLFFNKFYLFYELGINVFMKAFIFFDDYSYNLIFGKPTIVLIIIYYLILLCFFIYREKESKARYAFLCLILSILGYQYFKPYLNNREEIIFLDVGQGDCTIFIIPHSKEVILLDTGGSMQIDVSKETTIPYLMKRGYNSIKKVIISHDDHDHKGGLESLIKNFDVQEVIDSSLINNVKIGKQIFKNLNINERRDNEGSIVLYGKYAGYNLLLMGDAPADSIERKIIQSGEDLEVDILKIGHHGSNSSSCREFLNYVGAKIAIISVGKNSYGHPHKDVISRLEEQGYIIVRTDKNGNISFKKYIFVKGFVDYS